MIESITVVNISNTNEDFTEGGSWFQACVNMFEETFYCCQSMFLFSFLGYFKGGR